VPRRIPQALIVGKILHQAFENAFKSTSATSVSNELASLLLPFGDSVLTEKEEKAYDELTGLVEPLKFWKDNFPIERVLEVEEPFEFPLQQGLTFQGRPDRVAVVFGKAFHIQNKSISSAKDLGNYITLAGRSLHELLYGYHLRKKYAITQGLEYGGTIYNIVKKLKYRSKVVSKAEPLGKILNTPESMFLQTVIGLSKEAENIARRELVWYAYEMEKTAKQYQHGETVGSNRNLDSGYFGHGIDLYTQVMMGEISLDDDTYFMDREQTYAKVEE
jgi:hypothetical protein